jgi:hypothetical protein
MKWTDEQIETLRKLCFEDKSNAEIAITLQRTKSEIYAKRSQLGITRDKVKAAKSQDTQQKYIDNRPELKARLRKDYNLPEDPVVEAILEAVVSMVGQGYMEMVPVMEKYNDLVCRWCGRLHYRDVCEEHLRAR